MGNRKINLELESKIHKQLMDKFLVDILNLEIDW